MTRKQLIVSLYRQGVPMSELTRRFQCSRQRIENIVDGAFIGKQSVKRADAAGLSKLSDGKSPRS